MKPKVQHIAITKTDNSLSIMQFVLKGNGIPDRQGTDQEINDEIAKAGIPVASWRRINPSDIPTDRSDRNAWADNGKEIHVDTKKKAALEAATVIPRDPLAELDALKASLQTIPAFTDAVVALSPATVE